MSAISWSSRLFVAMRKKTAQEQAIYIEVSKLYTQDAGTGIQRVVRALYQELRAIAPADVNILPVISRGCTFRVVEPHFLNLPYKMRRPTRIARPKRGDIFLGLDLNAQKIERRSRRLQHWRDAGVLIAFVVYDLLPIKRPEWFMPRLVSRFLTWFRVISSSSDLLLCISQAVLSNVEHAWAQSPQSLSSKPRTMVIPLGSDFDTHQLTHDGTLSPTQRLMLQVPFALMVGTLEPRKGYSDALDAFEKLWSLYPETLQPLVIVGRRGWKTEMLVDRITRHPQNGRRLFWLEGVSDHELADIYNRSAFVIAASHDEGFGLPLIEAARAGRPVLARDIPVFREVASGSHAFFMTDGSNLYNLCREAFEEALPWETTHGETKQTSWKDSAAALYDIIQHALENKILAS